MSGVAPFGAWFILSRMDANAAFRQVWHVEQNRLLLARARWCDGFFPKLRGFTGKRDLGREEALVLVEKRDSRLNSAIHMLFVHCELGVVWVNQAGLVVDITIAQPWRLQYAPQQPASYVLECHPAVASAVAVGDHLDFQPIPLATPT